MKYLIHIGFLFTVFTINAQNLVKNSGFEEYWRLQKLLGYEADTFFCENWYLPSLGTVDYYTEGNILELNTKKTLHLLDVPNNLFGHHPSIEGKSYVGFIPLSIQGEMEHIIGELDYKLIKNKVYEVSFHIKHGGDSIKYSNTKFEVKFFNESDFFKGKNPFDTEYGIDMFNTNYKGIFQKSNIIADVTYDLCEVNNTNQWIKVTGNYVAKGGESYLGLGLFYQGEKLKEILQKYLVSQKVKKFIKKQSIIKINKTYVQSNTFFGNENITYYFIDEVIVEEIK